MLDDAVSDRAWMKSPTRQIASQATKRHHQTSMNIRRARNIIKTRSTGAKTVEEEKKTALRYYPSKNDPHTNSKCLGLQKARVPG